MGQHPELGSMRGYPPQKDGGSGGKAENPVKEQ